MQLRGTLTTHSNQRSEVSQPLAGEQAKVRLALSDYIMLIKPRIISLLLVTTLVPMYLAGKNPPDGWLILWTLLGGTLAAGGANTINQYVDRDIDHVMVRTRRRMISLRMAAKCSVINSRRNASAITSSGVSRLG